MTDSQSERALQVADVIAWSLFQKYEREDEGLYHLIERKIAGEVMLLR